MKEYLIDKRKKLILEEYLLSRFSDYMRDGMKVVGVDIKTMIPNASELKTKLIITMEGRLLDGSLNHFSRTVMLDKDLNLIIENEDLLNIPELTVLRLCLRDFCISKR